MLVSELGEEALLERLRRLFAGGASAGSDRGTEAAASGARIDVGIGDDAAVFTPAPGRQQVLTTDLLVEGVHFQRQWQTARALGRKCLAVNLSDIAAMAATPRWALIAFAIPDDTRVDFVVELAEGILELAQETGVAIVGGDTTSSKYGIIISVALGGEQEPGMAMLRSGARPGDVLVVTGQLGSAAGGLALAREGRLDESPALAAAFTAPQARLEAAALARELGATAMTDVSDGLASDLRHICQESGTGATIEWSALAIDPELVKMSKERGWDLEEMVLAGGEDYELLFSMPAGEAEAVAARMREEAGVTAGVIGRVEPQAAGIGLIMPDGSRRQMPSHGYEHFTSER